MILTDRPLAALIHAFALAGAMLAVATGAGRAASGTLPALKTGDIVFQNDADEQGLAIMLATASPYTHVGLIEIDSKGRTMVVEAVGPVRTIPLERWIGNGTGKRITVKRLKGLTEADARRAVARAHVYDGRPYDQFFYETRDKIYCSELIYAAFKEGPEIDVGTVERVRDLKVGNEAVRAVIEDRWTKHPLCQKGPNRKFEACYQAILDQTLVTPASIARDPKMETVYSNFGLGIE